LNIVEEIALGNKERKWKKREEFEFWRALKTSRKKAFFFFSLCTSAPQPTDEEEWKRTWKRKERNGERWSMEDVNWRRRNVKQLQ
jgi:hypothetical protein